MPLSHLEHFLVQTADIDGTCDWYERVLGLRRGATPDFKFPVQWLYLGDRDVIHVTEGGAQTSENPSAPGHPIAVGSSPARRRRAATRRASAGRSPRSTARRTSCR